MFIRRLERETVSKSGKIFLAVDPDKAEVNNFGVIVAVGENVKDSGCKAGVRVAFDHVLGLPLEVEDTKYLVISEKDIICYFYDIVGESE